MAAAELCFEFTHELLKAVSREIIERTRSQPACRSEPPFEFLPLVLFHGVVSNNHEKRRGLRMVSVGLIQGSVFGLRAYSGLPI
jgi:hypothetical protein